MSPEKLKVNSLVFETFDVEVQEDKIRITAANKK